MCLLAAKDAYYSTWLSPSCTTYRITPVIQGPCVLYKANPSLITNTITWFYKVATCALFYLKRKAVH